MFEVMFRDENAVYGKQLGGAVSEGVKCRCVIVGIGRIEIDDVPGLVRVAPEVRLGGCANNIGPAFFDRQKIEVFFYQGAGAS